MKNDPADPVTRVLADYGFDLPDRLIARHPPAERGDSRLLVVPATGPAGFPGGFVGTPTNATPEFLDRRFADLPGLLEPGDLLVVNNTRVSHRRLELRRSTGARIEALFLRPLTNDGPPEAWACLIRGLAKLKDGERLQAPGGLEFAFVRVPTIEAGEAGGNGVLRPVLPGSDEPAWQDATEAEAYFADHGQVPIPPYLGRVAGEDDRRRYQTIYADRPGSVAAPTAGLHFTQSIIEEIRARDIEIVSVELEIGYGTFAPLSAENFTSGRLHQETYQISTETADRLNRPGRRIAVGTTALRALEANIREQHPGNDGPFTAGRYSTGIFLHPPDHIHSVDGLITNFHLPESSLLMLVACFTGRERVLAAYRHAVRGEYRFFSYGDAMLLWNDRGP